MGMVGEGGVSSLHLQFLHMYSKIYGQMVSDDTATVYYFPSRIFSSSMA